MIWRPHRLAAALLAMVGAAWAGALALAVAIAEPPAGDGLRLVVFPPWLPDEKALAALVDAGARPVRPTGLPGVWVADVDATSTLRLRAAGSSLVVDNVPFGPVLAGCSL